MFVSRSDREQARSYKKRGWPQLRNPDEIRGSGAHKSPGLHPGYPCQPLRRSRLAGDPSMFACRSDREQARSYKKRGRPQLRSPDEIRGKGAQSSGIASGLRVQNPGIPSNKFQKFGLNPEKWTLIYVQPDSHESGKNS
nr:hypothetical protein [Pseudomonas alcaliphila]